MRIYICEEKLEPKNYEKERLCDIIYGNGYLGSSSQSWMNLKINSRGQAFLTRL